MNYSSLSILYETELIDLRLVPEDTIKSQFFYTDSERYFLAAFFPALILFGLIGNVGFLVVVAKIPDMRTFTNAYLTNMAVCDIALLLWAFYDILLPYILSPDVRTKLYRSDVACIAGYAFVYVNHFTADSLVVLVSFERYLAVCKPG